MLHESLPRRAKLFRPCTLQLRSNVTRKFTMKPFISYCDYGELILALIMLLLASRSLQIRKMANEMSYYS